MLRETWQEEIVNAYASIEDLVRAGFVPASDMAALRRVCATTLLRIPHYYASLFDSVSPATCPIRAQALPSLQEFDPTLPPWAQEFCQRAFGRPIPWSADAIGDVAHLGAPRLTHRYGNRAIVHVTTACALYCRFCFRKSHLGSGEDTLYGGSLSPALNYIETHPEVREVILTGGDPLSMSDAWLRKFLGHLNRIDHVRVVRLHSRMPVTLPARLTADMGDALAAFEGQVALVSHFNHPRELTPTALARLDVLRRHGVVLYNQSVLLRGVNNDADVLHTLFSRLYEGGITPFYLHHPDWTPQTFHFRSPIAEGRALMAQLDGRLSGPARPRYVVDMPGGDGKVDVTQMQLLEERHTSELGGALYSVQLPRTRSGAGMGLYADLWR